MNNRFHDPSSFMGEAEDTIEMHGLSSSIPWRDLAPMSGSVVYSGLKDFRFTGLDVWAGVSGVNLSDYVP